MSRKKTTISNFSVFITNINALVDKIGSKYDLAEAIGVSYDAVRQWCNGENLPDGKRLLLIHQKFNVSLDWLLTGEGTGSAVLEASAGRDADKMREILKAGADETTIKKRLDQIEKRLKHIEGARNTGLEKSSGID